MIDLKSQKETIRKRLEMHFGIPIISELETKINQHSDLFESETNILEILYFKTKEGKKIGSIQKINYKPIDQFNPENIVENISYKISGAIAILNPKYLFKQ